MKLAFLKANVWRISAALAVVALIGGAVYVSRSQVSEAFPAMPAEQQDYWAWVTSINRGSDAALEAGIALLEEHPGISRLYLRLAELCIEEQRRDECASAFNEVFPPDPRAALYREAARAQLVADQSAESAIPLWRFLSTSAHLDPGIARLIVDASRADNEADWSDDLVQIWEDELTADPNRAGAAFGLGYLAVIDSEWERGEEFLREATRLLPDDPEAYRELGRIYYTTGRPDDFEAALTKGIESAKLQHDVEKELILRGNLGLGVRQRGNLELAEAMFESALAQSRTIRDAETEGFNLYRLALLRMQQYRHYDALQLLKDAEKLYGAHNERRRPEVTAQVGVVLGNLFRFADAESILEAAIKDARLYGNIEAELHSFIALASLQYQMGRYEASYSTANDLLRLATATGHIDAAISARIIVGDLYSIDGDFDDARVEYESALALASDTKNTIRKRELYDRLGGLSIDLHDANAAQAYFEDLLDELRESSQPSSIADAYIGLGRTYQEFRNYEEADRFYNLALQFVDRESEARKAFDVLIGKAWAYLYREQYEQATTTLDSAAVVANVPHDKYRLAVARGNIYLEQDSFQAALEHFDAAERLVEDQQWPLNWHWHVFHAKALSFWGLGQMRAAERSFERSVYAIEQLRENLTSSEDRAVFVHNKSAVYKNYASFLESLGRFGEAFHLTERARSRSLVDLLYTTQRERRHSDHVEDQAIEAARQLRALAEEERQLSEQLEYSSSAVLLTQIQNVQREGRRADSVRAALDYSDVSGLYTFDPVSASEARALVQPGEAMVVYNLRYTWRDASTSDASVAYVVLPDTIVVADLDIDAGNISDAVKFLREQIEPAASGPKGGWEPTSRRLYRDLIAPVVEHLPEGTRHLVLIPEGILHYLPFAALLNPSDSFLIEEYSLSVAPSVSVLQLCRDGNPRQWRSMLLLADPDGRLPGSRQEAIDIASQSPNRRLAFVGESASQSLLVENAEYYDILHIATHGVFNQRAPWRSHLELYDDVLNVAEIGSLNLEDSYLVTLSACETALSGGAISDIPDGDEWVGLNQAFLAAGAPTVMASLWPIDDRVSSSFMVQFYEYLGAVNKAEALAAVQRKFSRSTATRHPFYWAAFTLIGDSY